MTSLQLNSYTAIIRIKDTGEIVTDEMNTIQQILMELERNRDHKTVDELSEFRKKLEELINIQGIDVDLKDSFPNKLHEFKKEISVLCSKLP